MNHLWTLSIAVFVSCGGGLGGASGGEEGDACSSSADCDGDLACAGVNDAPVCGIPPIELCRSDLECAGGTVCHAVNDPCSPDGVGSACDVPCSGDDDCEDGFACGLEGACVARSCEVDFACADREICDTARIAADAPVFDRHHGCFAIACTDDVVCGDRFCVNGTCQDSPGTCTEVVLVP